MAPQESWPPLGWLLKVCAVFTEEHQRLKTQNCCLTIVLNLRSSPQRAHLLGFKERPPHSLPGKEASTELVSPGSLTHSFGSCHRVVAKTLMVIRFYYTVIYGYYTVIYGNFTDLLNSWDP